MLDSQGSDRVWSYDYATGAVDTATLHVRLEKDDHDNPALYVRTDGRITAFYQRHTVDRNVYIRTTVDPEDIRTWGASISPTTRGRPVPRGRDPHQKHGPGGTEPDG